MVLGFHTEHPTNPLKHFHPTSNVHGMTSITPAAPSVSNAFKLERLTRNTDSTCCVEQLPKRNQITFGGNPKRTLNSGKSASFVTITKPFVLANSQTTKSSAVPKPCVETWLESAKASCNAVSVACQDHNFVRFTVGNIRETGVQIIFGQVREILENFGSGHAAREG
jgi:hypothetical protein